MTDDQFAALSEYLKYTMANLELSDWRFIISHDPPDHPDAYAMVEPVEGRKLFTIRVCSDFFALPIEKQRHTLIHECLHLLHNDQTNMMRLALPSALGSTAYDVLWEPFRLATEIMVDTLAYVIEDYAKEYPRENKLLWALRGELPPPKPGTVVSAPQPGLDPKES